MSTCSECKVKTGITCCELPTPETPQFGVTLPEVQRLKDVLDIDVGKCFVSEPLTDEEYNEFVLKSDVFSQVFADKVRIRLKVINKGDLSSCVFLTKSEGCCLPEEVRPHSCRLYPFWFERKLVKGDDTDKTSLTLVNGLFPSVCYGKSLAKSADSGSEAEALFTLFGTSEVKLLGIAKQMLRDASIHAKLVKSSRIALAEK